MTDRGEDAERSPWAPPPTPPGGEASAADTASRWAPPEAGPTRRTSPPGRPPLTYWTSEPAETSAISHQAPSPSRSRRWLPSVALVVGLVAGFVVIVALVSRIGSTSSPAVPADLPTLPPLSSASSSPETAPTSPPAAVDPAASVLAGLVVRQTDVGSPATVQLLPGGGEVNGQPTLDLCNGTFATEALRTARLQVTEADTQGRELLSTEAVLYSSTGDTVEAFLELQRTAARCPATPVVSPVGELTVTTRYHQPPDTLWGQTPTVDRLAFDFTSTDAAGQSRRSVAVYLRRGRVLLGVYFPMPEATQPAVNGQTSLAAIVKVFATRMAQLPASVVNGS